MQVTTAFYCAHSCHVTQQHNNKGLGGQHDDA